MLTGFTNKGRIKMEGWASLLRSRKVLLAVLAVVNTVVSHYLEIPAEVWQSVDALLVVLIAAIAYEDGQKKRARE